MIQGKFIINGKEYPNDITEAGLVRMLNILNGSVRENIRLKYMQFGTSNNNPSRNRTSLTAPVGNKFEIGSYSVNSNYPFDMELSTVIPTDSFSTDILVKEMAIYFEPENNGILFARATYSNGILIPKNAATPITYSLIIT